MDWSYQIHDTLYAKLRGLQGIVSERDANPYSVRTYGECKEVILF